MVFATGNICLEVSNSEASQITGRHITCSGLLKQFVSNARQLLGFLSATLKSLLGIKHLYKKKLVNTYPSEVLGRICKEIRTLDDEQLKADTSITNAIIHAIANGEVESLVDNKILKNLPNDEGMTAREYFTKHHEELRKRGEKWMKETALSYSFVAALIVTITFAAGYIVSGGGNDVRSLVQKKWLLVFIISDAASLFSSTTSVLMFLGILTSRYYEEAFLTSLPTKLILGMSTLFFSIATMMICYCAALYEIRDS